MIVFLSAGVKLVFDSWREDAVKGGVQGWLNALSMATVDDYSPSTRHWCQSTGNLWRELEASGQGQNEIIRATAPRQVKILDEDEVARIASKIRSKRDNWIHMNERAGGLPVFMYGTYWMYLAFDKPWPSKRNMELLRHKYKDIGNMTHGKGRMTSNMEYGSSVKLYNQELREEVRCCERTLSSL
jgi:hypothetical protein